MGRSLGGAVAVDLAARHPLRGLVLENTFNRLPDVAATHYPWLPVRLIMRTQFDSVSKIGKYRGPIFQSHGTADEIVPIELGRHLFDAAEEPKEFIPLSGSRHNDARSPAYWSQLQDFLRSLED